MLYRKSGCVVDSVKVTVVSSTALMSVTFAYSDAAGEPTSLLLRRLNVQTTSSAVMALPSWNLTPFARLNVYCLPSSLTFQDWARRGDNSAVGVGSIR